MRLHVPLLLLVSLAAAASASGQELAVIVHADRDERLSLEDVSRIYLKQKRFWGDGQRIVPVNRESGSEARSAFARLVFGAAARQLVVYWNRQYFRGVLPPATLASDEAVKRFVAGERRAIGYVDARLIDDTVRAVLRLRLPDAGGAGPRPPAAATATPR